MLSHSLMRRSPAPTGDRHEVAVAAASPDATPTAGLFRPLTRTHTGTLFSALFFSDVGGWVQMLVVTWMVLRGPNPALWLPALMAARAAPKLLASPFAGMLADRFDRLTLYRASRCLAILPPLGLTAAAGGLLPWTSWSILVVAAFGSVLAAVDQPARRGLLWDVSGPARVLGVVSLNTAAFQSAASLAPALAVMLVGSLGSTSALAAAVVIKALSAACAWSFAQQAGPRPVRLAPEHCPHPLGGVGYVLRTPRALLLLCLTGAPGLAGRALAIVIPIIAGGHAHASLAGTGALASAPGAGAFVAAVALAVLGEISGKSRFAFACAAAFAASIALYPLSDSLYQEALLLALSGACSASFGTVVFSMLHLQVPDDLRGRVMAL